MKGVEAKKNLTWKLNKILSKTKGVIKKLKLVIKKLRVAGNNSQSKCIIKNFKCIISIFQKKVKGFYELQNFSKICKKNKFSCKY